MPCEAAQKYNQPAVLAQTFGILQSQLMLTPAITIENYSPIDVRVARFATAKAFAKNVFINQERKLKVRRRLDTALVLTINETSTLEGSFAQS